MLTETKIEMFTSLREVDREQFNAIVDDGNPFLEYEFLSALEESGSVGENTGWVPRYLILKKSDRIIAALTWYLKFDSYGEYIFDWEWAAAFQSAGISYYPKAVVAIPFTPATGTRISISAAEDYSECFSTLVSELVRCCEADQVSSIHFLFTTENEKNLLAEAGFLTRIGHQFHWVNQNYNEFDDFLAALRSKKRKQINRERRAITEADIKIHTLTSSDITEEHINVMWSFYVNTTSSKWGRPYLNEEFFQLIYKNFQHRMCLILAEDHEGFAGGTWNMFKNDQLFGRYWGSLRYYPQLHFECCYYSLIDFAIAGHMSKFEAGAQGEHKFLRGFPAQPTYSSHLIFNTPAREAIEKFLAGERNYVLNMITEYNSKTPFRRDEEDEEDDAKKEI